MRMLERALEIARQAHAGQIDKAGRPYMEHVLRVVAAVEGEDAKVVAALHDVLEDGEGWNTDRLRQCGILHILVLDVIAMTRPRASTYQGYIENVARFPRAHAVKIADLRDHLHPERVGTLTPSHVERYRRALRQLGADEGGGDARV